MVMIPWSVFVPGTHLYQLCVDEGMIMFVDPSPPRLGYSYVFLLTTYYYYLVLLVVLLVVLVLLGCTSW